MSGDSSDLVLKLIYDKKNIPNKLPCGSLEDEELILCMYKKELTYMHEDPIF